MGFETEHIGDCTLYRGDCLGIMPMLDPVDAVVTDPPYFKVKPEDWDNRWQSADDFIGWVGLVVTQIKKIVAFNGSLYWFCSPQMAARIEIMISSEFAVLNSIVWDKSGTRKGAAGSGIDVNALRCFWSANTERLIFAEPLNSDGMPTGQAGFEAAENGLKAEIFGAPIQKALQETIFSRKDLAALFPSKTGRLTGCTTNWVKGFNIPTPQQWAYMVLFFNGALTPKYEALRAKYEALRRPFHAEPSSEWGDVWRFAVERNQAHPTQKPLVLMRHIVSISTNKSSTIIDPFMGSGTTGVACVKLGRKFIGIELEQKYFDIACERIQKAYDQPDLFIEERKKPMEQTGMDFDGQEKDPAQTGSES